MQDKPEPLQIKKSKITPVSLPQKRGQFGPPGSAEGDETKSRAERRRDHRTEQKQKKKILGAIKKRQQELQKPLRYKDMGLIVSQVFGQLQPVFRNLQDQLDKLSYLPDYIAECMTGITVTDKEQFTLPSVGGFEEWFEKLKADLEAQESSGEEGEPVKGQAMAVEEEAQRDDSDTEVAQEEQVT